MTDETNNSKQELKMTTILDSYLQRAVESAVSRALALPSGATAESAEKSAAGCNSLVGEYVIVRTDRAGVFFGKILEKAGNEIILGDARMLFRWKAASSVSLSAVALYGIDSDRSRITAPVSRLWVQPITLITLTDVALQSLLSAPETAAD